MHAIVDPVTFVPATIVPLVHANTLDVVVFEFTLILTLIRPAELTPAVFLALIVLAFVLCTVRPHLFAFAVLFIFEPVTLVSRTISVVVRANAVGFVVLPFTVVDVAISMDQSSASVCLVFGPVSFVHAAVDPNLATLAIFATLNVPLARILRTSIQRHCVLPYATDTIWLWFWSPHKLTQFLSGSFHELFGSSDFFSGGGLILLIRLTDELFFQ